MRYNFGFGILNVAVLIKESFLLPIETILLFYYFIFVKLIIGIEYLNAKKVCNFFIAFLP